MSGHITEPLLDCNDKRFVMFPIQDQKIWEMYQKAEDNNLKIKRDLVLGVLPFSIVVNQDLLDTLEEEGQKDQYRARGLALHHIEGRDNYNLEIAGQAQIKDPKIGIEEAEAHKVVNSAAVDQSIVRDLKGIR